MNKQYIIVRPEERITNPIMTKYEIAHVTGLRAEELARSKEKPRIKVPAYAVGDYKKIAMLELINHAIPYVILRKRPHDDKYESFCIYDDPKDKSIHCELSILVDIVFEK